MSVYLVLIHSRGQDEPMPVGEAALRSELAAQFPEHAFLFGAPKDTDEWMFNVFPVAAGGDDADGPLSAIQDCPPPAEIVEVQEAAANVIRAIPRKLS